MFASLVIGAPVNPLESSFTCADIVHIFRATKPKIIFCDYDLVIEVRNVIEELQIEIIIVSMDQYIDGCDVLEDYFMEINGECEIM